MDAYAKIQITAVRLAAGQQPIVDLWPFICAPSYFKTCQIRDRPLCERQPLLCALPAACTQSARFSSGD